MKKNLLKVLGTGVVLISMSVGALVSPGCTNYEQKCVAVEEILDLAGRTGEDYSLGVFPQVGVGF